MYSIRQNFPVDGNIKEIKIKENDFDSFKSEYFEATKDLTIDGIMDNIQCPDQARIIVDIFFDNDDDYMLKEKVVKSLGPIFEIALDNTYQVNDDRYLLKYQKEGAYFKKHDGYFSFSLGDSNEPKISFSMIALVYALVNSKDILQMLSKIFELTTTSIIDGGYNSASYNGLQGYYFSRYFVKWLLDIRELANKYSHIDKIEFDEIFYLIENLENPKDRALNN